MILEYQVYILCLKSNYIYKNIIKFTYRKEYNLILLI